MRSRNLGYRGTTSNELTRCNRFSSSDRPGQTRPVKTWRLSITSLNCRVGGNPNGFAIQLRQASPTIEHAVFHRSVSYTDLRHERLRCSSNRRHVYHYVSTRKNENAFIYSFLDYIAHTYIFPLFILRLDWRWSSREIHSIRYFIFSLH